MKNIIPEKALDQHILVLGKTRSGKSSAMRVLVEHLLDEEKPVCIIDPKGDWWGLKASADGKRPGYPIIIFGGEHADVPINSRSGAAVAELACTGNRPCIIDLGGWMPGARTEFFVDFASTFFRLTRGRRWLVIDEVHIFCPQGKVLDPQAGKMLHWSNRLASEGLGKGISLIAASQRPQKVHKDFVTSAETLIAMRVIHPLDRGAIRDWIDGCGDSTKGKEVLDTLASMQRGEGWVWSPEIGFGPKVVKFPMFKTYDSFKAQVAQHPEKLKGWADVDLKEVTAKLADVVKEAEATDPKKLQARIRELEKQVSKKGHVAAVLNLTELGKRMPNPTITVTPDPKVIERAIKPIRAEHLAALKRARTRLVSLARVPIAGFADLHDSMVASTDLEMEALEKISGGESIKGEVRTTEHPAPHQNRVIAASPRPIESNGRLPEGELAILKATAQYDEGVERDQLTTLTGYKRSTRDAYLLRLRNKQFVAEKSDRIFITSEGMGVLGDDYEPLPTGDALQQYWLSRLPEGERRILKTLVEAGSPVAVERDALTEITGYKRSTRDAYLLRMEAKKIIENVGRGQVKASELLFG